jgi:hypothetical protein
LNLLLLLLLLLHVLLLISAHAMLLLEVHQEMGGLDILGVRGRDTLLLHLLQFLYMQQLAPHVNDINYGHEWESPASNGRGEYVL